MISLQNRIALTYALLISAFLAVLVAVINIFTGLFFSALVKENIATQSAEIARAVVEQYDPQSGFDLAAVETMGMYFVHQGYILSVEDGQGGDVWSARSCDMMQCTMVIDDISARMEKKFRVRGELRQQRFPLKHEGSVIGNLAVETYGPFFYSETETNFLSSINRLLAASGIFFIALSVALSIVLARSIARPILKAKDAARRIAELHAGGQRGQRAPNAPVIRLDEKSHTRELNELSRSINTLALALEASAVRQKQFTADIAHELRTPLTCLQGNVEAMIDGVWQADSERLASCHEEILRLTRLVADLNTLSGLEWQTLTLNKTEFDLAKLLRITAEQFMPAAAKKGIALRLDFPITRTAPITADYDRLKQVFINLLANAVQYTDKGSVTISVSEEGEHGIVENTGRISPYAPKPRAGRNVQASPVPPAACLSATPTAGGSINGCPPPATPPISSWVITVSDTGIGIPPEDLPRVFERLYRSDKSRSRSTGGSGIGLAIAEAIVRAHGGAIGVAPNARHTTGSTFSVRLNT